MHCAEEVEELLTAVRNKKSLLMVVRQLQEDLGSIKSLENHFAFETTKHVSMTHARPRFTYNFLVSVGSLIHNHNLS